MELADLCSQIKKEQQWGRLSNLEIAGLPENSKESTSELIIKIASHAGIKLTDDQIVFAHRVQPMQNVGALLLGSTFSQPIPDSDPQIAWAEYQPREPCVVSTCDSGDPCSPPYSDHNDVINIGPCNPSEPPVNYLYGQAP
ncbi:unnamed protein product [Parnassius apollo]|uniref:(apollo) hypothetical protein n=1 Tax=Parnassius apollo TaxID=110799 RepID=A0A8S3Y7M4_PARAO|nr:unnamed protein product [Parnassius apollo]